jgi:transcriptional regulator with XRE-family HTH domain
MNIGTTIKELRQQQGIKQKNLAERCNITPSYLSQIEKNQKEPTLSVLKSISEVLDTSLTMMFFLATNNQEGQRDFLDELIKRATAKTIFSNSLIIKNPFQYNDGIPF